MQNSEKWSIVKYKKGSYITLEGAPSKGVFYIIKEGEVLSRDDSVLQSEIIYHPGDFISVIPGLTNHDCSESNIALTDIVIIPVSRVQVPILIKNKASVALKMLKIFTQKLRMYNYCIETLSGATKPAISQNNSAIFFTAKYYYKDSKQYLAQYALQKYLEMSPDGEYREEATLMLEDISDTQNIEVVNDKQYKRYQDCQFVFCEGETGNELYFIRSGRIKITKVSSDHDTIFAILGPGDIFGEMAILDNKNRSANAITVGETELMVINKNAFKHLIETQLEIVVNIITALADRVWLASKTAENLVMQEPIAKMYRVLVAILKKDHVEFNSKEAHKFPFSLIDLAHMAGIDDKQNVTNCIAQIKKEKIIREVSKNIYLNDLKKLEDTATYHKTLDLINKKKQKAKIYVDPEYFISTE